VGQYKEQQDGVLVSRKQTLEILKKYQGKYLEKGPIERKKKIALLPT
jgi:hypothetical protein